MIGDETMTTNLSGAREPLLERLVDQLAKKLDALFDKLAGRN
jgi:hypothetical protein